MTVKELIDKLNKLNLDTDTRLVAYSETEGYGFVVEDVEIGKFVGFKEPCIIMQLD